MPSNDPPLELSLHRFRDGEVQPLDERRYLHEHEFAVVEDEEIVSIDTPDGGSAWISGAGPGGRGDHGRATGIDVSVDVLSEQLTQILFSHAERGAMVFALWAAVPQSGNYFYAWEPGLEAALEEAHALGLNPQVRSIPLAVLVTTADQTGHLPTGWPAPAVCATAQQLFELLSTAPARS
jgi:hypothetical protein